MALCKLSDFPYSILNTGVSEGVALDADARNVYAYSAAKQLSH